MYKILAHTLFIAKQVISLPTCHSSNDTARQLAHKADTLEGAVVICQDQTGGKGQRGNTWEAVGGKNLTLSVILRPRFLNVKQQFYLNMIASLAVKEAINSFAPAVDLRVKWPNDVLLNQKKISGILIENSINGHALETAVIGIGINVNQTDFSAPKATSMALATGSESDLNQVYGQLLANLENQYLRLKAGRFAEIKADYLKHLFGFGENRRYLAEYRFEGEIEDVTYEGRLVIRGPQGRQTYDLKEIEFIY